MTKEVGYADGYPGTMELDNNGAWRRIDNVGHDFRYLWLTIPSGSAFSDVVDMRFFTQGLVLFPAATGSAWTAADLGYYTAVEPTGDFYEIRDAANGAVKSSYATGSWAAIPTGTAGAGYVKLQSRNASGVNVLQAGERRLLVMLKS